MQPSSGWSTKSYTVLDRAGAAMPLVAAGTELLTRIAHGDHPDNVVRACALVGVVVELDKDALDGVRFVRLEGETPWLVRRDELEVPLRAPGAAADELAARDILAGPAEAHRALESIVEKTPLAALASPADGRLIRLAAAASRGAAASSRLELDPRGMDGARALELSAAILPAKITEPKLRELVEARYPDAAALPARPALDDLVEHYGLHYVPSEAIYARPGSDPAGRPAAQHRRVRQGRRRGAHPAARAGPRARRAEDRRHGDS